MLPPNLAPSIGRRGAALLSEVAGLAQAMRRRRLDRLSGSWAMLPGGVNAA